MNDELSLELQKKHADKLEKKLNRLDSVSHRIWELDFLRGICILLMIWDHFMVINYNFFIDSWAEVSQLGEEFYSFVETYLMSSLRYNVRALVVVTFFSFCGISCSFSKSNLKRGAIMAVCCFLITLVTNLLEIPIWFGALHLLTAGVLAWCLIYFLCKKNKEVAGLACFFIGTILLGLDFLFSNIQTALPQSDFLALLGPYFAPDSFTSYDYFPILPYLGFVLLGCFGGVFIYKNKKSLLPKLDVNRWYRPFAFVGRKGLIIYVLHQVFLGALLGIISFLFITPGDFLII